MWIYSNSFPPVSSLQSSSWLPDCWSTRSAWTPPWSGPSVGTLTSTTPASARSGGATCWLLSELCSLSSCPFLLNMHQRSSCPPPLCQLSYSALKLQPGLDVMRRCLHPTFFTKVMLFEKPHSVITDTDPEQQTPSSCSFYVINWKAVNLNWMFCLKNV